MDEQRGKVEAGVEFLPQKARFGLILDGSTEFFGVHPPGCELRSLWHSPKTVNKWMR